MDSAEAMTNMIKHWKARGYTGVHMRTDMSQVEPLIHRNPTKTQESPGLAVLWKQVDEAMESYDGLPLFFSPPLEREFHIIGSVQSYAFAA